MFYFLIFALDDPRTTLLKSIKNSYKRQLEFQSFLLNFPRSFLNPSTPDLQQVAGDIKVHADNSSDDIKDVLFTINKEKNYHLLNEDKAEFVGELEMLSFLFKELDINSYRLVDSLISAFSLRNSPFIIRVMKEEIEKHIELCSILRAVILYLTESSTTVTPSTPLYALQGSVLSSSTPQLPSPAAAPPSPAAAPKPPVAVFELDLLSEAQKDTELKFCKLLRFVLEQAETLAEGGYPQSGFERFLEYASAVSGDARRVTTRIRSLLDNVLASEVNRSPPTEETEFTAYCRSLLKQHDQVYKYHMKIDKNLQKIQTLIPMTSSDSEEKKIKIKGLFSSIRKVYGKLMQYIIEHLH